MTSIQSNLQDVRGRIATACAQAGRPAASVLLLAVSKTMPAQAVLDAMAAGQRDFGENYVQEAVDKIVVVRAHEAGNPDLQHGGRSVWHAIGPIQSNKSRLVAEHFDWVHSIDRLKLAQRLSEQRPAALAPLDVCLQVNIDGGAAKSGVAPEEAAALARQVAVLPGLRLRGLMTIPEPASDPAVQLAVHERTRALFEHLRAEALPGATLFDTLSMGMSADLEAAVLAGSTIVRIGTAIFGKR